MYHYNAFISYNQNPRDSRIASTLQRQLENYKLPEGVKTSSGLTKIERVFMDKGELEVAGDLNTLIQEALANSDHLIVICSPESKKSVWVQREIDYFLQTHDADKVLTVITDGEPYDVLPDRLLYDESEADSDSDTVDKSDADEEVLPKRSSKEPLSCDYRLPEKTARRVELPRLVAALVGCRYDDLVQRQKQYRRRRMRIMAAASAAAMLISITYLVWSNHQIRASLKASQIEQSLSLAIQSEQALNSGDRIGAVELALEALPSEDDKRPVVPQAVLALSRSMDLYRVPSTDKTGRSVPVRKYPSYGSHILTMKAFSGSDRSFFAELYSSGRVAIWDADTGKELMADYTAGLIDEGVHAQNIAFNDANGQFIIVTEDSVRVIDPEKEKELKNIDLGGQYYKLYDFRLFRILCDDLAVNGNVLWLPVDVSGTDRFESASGYTDYGSEVDEVISYNSLHGSSKSFEIKRVDLSTGKITAKTSPAERPVKIIVSPDGKYIACRFSDFYEPSGTREAGNDTLAIADAETLDILNDIKRPCVTDFAFNGSGQIILCGFDAMPADNDYSLYDTMIMPDGVLLQEVSYAKKHNVVISAFEAASGNELWSHEETITTNGSPWITIGTKGSRYESNIICSTGTSTMILDSNGNEISSLSTVSAAVEHFYNTNSVALVQRNGEMSVWHPEADEAFTMYDTRLGSIDYIVAAGDYFFVMSSGDDKETVIQCDNESNDPKLEEYGYNESAYEGKEMEYIAAGSCDGSFVEIRSRSLAGEGDVSGEVTEVLVRDSVTGDITLQHNVVTSAPDTHGGVSEFKYAGTDSNRGKVYFIDNGDLIGLTLMSVDIKTGEEKKKALVINDPDSNNKAIGEDDYYIFMPAFSSASEGTMYDAGVYSVGEDSVDFAALTADFDETGDYDFRVVILSVDPETGKTEVHRIGDVVLRESYDCDVRLNANAKRAILREGSRITCYDYSGKVKWTIEELAYGPAEMAITDDGDVMILEKSDSKNILHIYDAKKGSETTTVLLESASTLYHEKMDWRRLSDDEVMVTIGDDAFILDSETWELRSEIIASFIAYDPVNRQFMLGDAQYRETWHAPYRSLDEMIEEARASLE